MTEPSPEQVVVLAHGDMADHGDDDTSAITKQVEQPAKVMRIGTMIKQLLEEVRAAPLDEAGRQRLAEIYIKKTIHLYTTCIL